MRSFRVLISKYSEMETSTMLFDEICNLLVSHFPQEEFERLVQKYPSHPNDASLNKYIGRYKSYIKRDLNRALSLALHQRKRIKILDVGSGFGWFGLICTKLGHDYVGLDDGKQSLYNESFALHGLKRYIHQVMPFQPLPYFDEVFDLVTCFQICFNLYPECYDWGPGEWAYFVHELANYSRDNVLELLVEFNFHKSDLHHGQLYSPMLKHWLLRYGFLFLSKSSVYFSSSNSDLPHKDWLDTWHEMNQVSIESRKFC